MVIEPPLVLMDEPLSNLDAKLRLEMRQEIRRIHAQIKATTLYVTHDQEEALSLADRVVVLRDGVIRQVGHALRPLFPPGSSRRRRFHGVSQPFAGRLCGSNSLDIGGAVLIGRPAGEDAQTIDAVAAIRPDDLHPGVVEGGVPAVVEAIEFRGREFYGLARTAAGMALYFSSDRPIGTGETVSSRRRARAGSPVSRGRAMSRRAVVGRAEGPTLVQHLALRGLDGVTLLVLPCVLLVLGLFVYPFFYGLFLSFQPRTAGLLGNYVKFLDEPFLYRTVWTTLRLALPVTAVNLAFSIPVAFRVRLMRHQRLLTTHPGAADHPRNGAGRRGHVVLFRAARVVQPDASVGRSDFDAGLGGAWLLGASSCRC